jgi:hypothetical protein
MIIVFERQFTQEMLDDFGSVLMQYEQFDGEPKMAVGGFWPNQQYETYKVVSVKLKAFYEEDPDWHLAVCKAMLDDVAAEAEKHPPSSHKIAWRIRPMYSMTQHGCQHCCGTQSSLAFSVTARCRLSFVKKEEYL